MTPSPTHGRAFWRLASAGALLLAMLAAVVGAAPQRALAVSPNIVISQVYGGGGNGGATFTHDFIELFNRGATAVSLAGWSVQYTSATGTGNFGSGTNLLTELPSVTLQPGQYFLIQEASNAAVGAPLPAPDLTDTTPINMSGSAGKVALVSGTTTLGCNGGSTSCSAEQLARIIDLVGFGGANFYEGAGPTAALTNTTAAFRNGGGCVDTDNNSADFSTATPTPRNTSSPLNLCGTPPATTVTVTASDASAAEAGLESGTFTIARSGDTTNALTVSFTVGGTAGAGDYAPALGASATIPAGQPSVVLTITPVDDSDVEGDETVSLTLNEDPAYAIGSPSSAAITIADNDVAGPTITLIHAIQGSGAASAPGTFTVEAIVVGDYQTQGSGQLRGFFIQEEDADADADPATSEGIFVFCTTCPVPVSVGDKVQVTGASSEFFNMSQLTASTAGSVTVLGSGNPLPTPAALDLPVPGVPSGDTSAAEAAINAYFEAFEGMLVTFPDTLSVTEYFELARYGQVILSADGRPYQFTHDNEPTEAGYIEHQIDLARRTIILDDTDNRQNRPVDTPNTNYYHPVPGLSTGNYFRGGDTITNLTGVLHWSFAGQTGTDAWRIRPVTEAYTYEFTPVNTRPATPPDVGGRLKVASFNVLNYFLTIDTTASNDVGICGPSGKLDCRGADSAQELQLQRTKLLAALAGLNADVIGVMEMENTPGVEPLADIVAGLPGYDFVDTGVTGTDAIRVGIIYDTTTVTPVGDPAVLDTQAFVNPRNATNDRNRPAVAQTFEENASGARFTVVVNHLKSKGSGCGPGDDDTTTGQGNCNLTRTLSAQVLANWLATDPTGSGDPDVLIIGDLNSNAMEDPITALKAAGYIDLVAKFGGPSAYGYVFDGQLGYLDHALANAELESQVTGVADWHINADEIPLLDYNDTTRDSGEAAFEEESDTLPLYEPNQFRTSDHDPVIVGLDLYAIPTITPTPLSGVCMAGNTASASLTVELFDLDSVAEELTFSASSSDGAISVQVAGSGSTRTLTFVVGGNPGTGSASGTVLLTVTDLEGGSSTLAVQVGAGTGGADTFTGSEGIDIYFGRGGDDTIDGAGGNDVLCGGNGDDTIYGGAGSDTLSGGNGADTLSGGSDADVFDVGNGADTLTDFNEAEGDTQTAS